MTLFKVKMRIRNSTTMTVDNISCLSIPILDVVPPKKTMENGMDILKSKIFSVTVL